MARWRATLERLRGPGTMMRPEAAPPGRAGSRPPRSSATAGRLKEIVTDELPLVVDRQRRGRGLVLRRRIAGQVAVRRLDVDDLQAVRVLPNCWSTVITTWYWFNCVYIVETALAEGVVERVVDQLGRDPQPRRGHAVDDERGLEALVLLVGRHVGELRQLPQRLEDFRRGGQQLLRVVYLERVLVLRRARSSARAHVLDRLEGEVGARDVGGLPPQPRDDLVGAGLAFASRLGRDIRPLLEVPPESRLRPLRRIGPS